MEGPKLEVTKKHWSDPARRLFRGWTDGWRFAWSRGERFVATLEGCSRGCRAWDFGGDCHIYGLEINLGEEELIMNQKSPNPRRCT